MLGIAYGSVDAPSTDVASTPFFTIASNGVPWRIDWPTMRCSQPTMLPWASSPARTEPHHGVERLHGSVRQIGELVERLENPGRAAKRAGGVALASCGRPGASGQHPIGREELVAAAGLGTALVPRHAQRLATLARRPEARRDDRDAGGHLHDARHALDAPGADRVDPLHGGAESRRPRDQRRQRAGLREVHSEL